METSTSQLLSIPSLVTGEPTEAEEYFLAQENAGWLEKKWHRAAAVTTNEIVEQFSRGLPERTWVASLFMGSQRAVFTRYRGREVGEGRESIFQRR